MSEKDPNPFGPTRGELRFRLVVSLAGLALLIFALFYRGIPEGPAIVEVVGLAGVFFGGSAIWSAVRLWKTR
jgi:xanthosine utilization system XapX-like protein